MSNYPRYEALDVPLGKNVGEGWLPIIENLIEALDKQFPGWACTQIKEKFGFLNFYAAPPANSPSEKFWSLIQEAEAKSKTTCEVCGQPGAVRNRKVSGSGWAWIKTLCKAHAKERNYVVD